MTVVILTEKPSAARNFATAFGGMKGTYAGTKYEIVHALGHLLEFKQPDQMVPPALAEKYKSWELANLPWDPADFSWEREIRRKGRSADPGARDLLKDLKASLGGASEIVLASDIDPSGEGGLLAWEIIDFLGLHGKSISRMEFLDEAPASLQKAFTSRRKNVTMETEGEYRKAQFRSQWDLLSMQWTRILTKSSGGVLLRTGRLKGTMTVLVGDQIAAYEAWKKVPFYENRFRDDHGVVYSDPEVERFPSADQVPQNFHASEVVHDGTSNKSTPPPKLLDLAGMSAILSKRGMAPKRVLETYQKMYEAQIVSYPRTSDRFVSPEQFNEMLPLIDKIAGVVGIDPAVLSHRTPRKGHVKTGGAHGANRPGLVVPRSLEQVADQYGPVGRAIYDLLAKNYLTMLAEDYRYAQHKGHVKDFPSFTGTLAVPIDQGWKGVFDADAAAADEEGDDEGSSKATSLGTRAEPFVHEGVPPRPAWPTMAWLMKQLDQRDVGTGATRTSTFSDITSGKTALMSESKGKITLTDDGTLAWRLLPGTRIGDVQLTEHVQKQMDAIASGELEGDFGLGQVASWITADITTVADNVARLPDELKAKAMAGQREYIELPESWWHAHGDFIAKRASREYFGHRFSDDQVAALLQGTTVPATVTWPSGQTETIEVELTKKKTTRDGTTYPVVGYVRVRTDQHTGIFAPTGKEVVFKARAWGANEHWPGHDFTADELVKLLAGEQIEFEAVSKRGSKYTAKGKLEAGTYNGAKTFGFALDTSGWGNSGSGAKKAPAKKAPARRAPARRKTTRR